MENRDIAVNVPYFANHGKKYQLPWSLYHRPILRELEAVIARTSGPCLNVGCGPFSEWERMSSAARARPWFATDLDARAVDAVTSRTPITAAVADGGAIPFKERFGLVVAMDVVEHLPTLPAAEAFIRDLVAATLPGGTVMMTTPNYSHWSSFGLIECTLLELAARRQGFTRAGIHPTKFTAGRLAAACLPLKARIHSIAFNWVLVASIDVPAA